MLTSQPRGRELRTRRGRAMRAARLIPLYPVLDMSRLVHSIHCSSGTSVTRTVRSASPGPFVEVEGRPFMRGRRGPAVISDQMKLAMRRASGTVSCDTARWGSPANSQ